MLWKCEILSSLGERNALFDKQVCFLPPDAHSNAPITTAAQPLIWKLKLKSTVDYRMTFFCSTRIFPPWPWVDVFFLKRLKITHINSAVGSNYPKVNYTEFIWNIFQEQSTYSHWWKRRPPSPFFGLPFIFDCVGVKLWHPLFSGCHSQGPLQSTGQLTLSNSITQRRTHNFASRWALSMAANHLRTLLKMHIPPIIFYYFEKSLLPEVIIIQWEGWRCFHLKKSLNVRSG